MRVRLAACLGISVLVASVPTARAEGINLYWNDCSPARGGAGVTAIANDCASNTGSLALVASFVPPAGVDSLLGLECMVYVTLAGPSVPSWWQLQTGGCRAGSLSATCQFPGLSACGNPWSDAGIAGTAYDMNPPCCFLPNIARIRAVGAVQSADAVAVHPGLEYYAFEIRIDRRKSIGAGSCAGCPTSACIELSFIKLYQPTSMLFDPAITRTDQNRYVTYNGAQVSDCAITPVRNRTWGAVKAIYR